ncbi:MAG: glycosyltransferase [Pseudomonadota bacterium]
MQALTVVIINDASIARGGATGLALVQARMLRALGLRVVFVAGDAGANPELEALGVEMRPLGGTHLMKATPVAAATRGLYNPAARDHLARVIAEVDSPQTVYHVHGFSKTLTPSIFAALAAVQRRCFLHAHDYFLGCPNGGFMDYRAMQPCTRVPLSAGCLATHCDKRSYPQKLWRVARQAALWRTLGRRGPWAGVLMIHPGMAPALQRSGYPAERLITLRNPAVAFRTDRVQAERNQRLVFVGRVEAEKGIEDLITAADMAQVPLVVIGDGPLREALQAQHPKVEFRGWMTRDQIGAAIGDARALVMPSRYPEPFGLVAAEASLSGLPVILPDTALLGPEVLARDLGLVCDTRNPVAFAATLRQMADLPPARIEAISRKGHAGTAALCATPDDWIAAQIALYEVVAGKAMPIAG